MIDCNINKKLNMRKIKDYLSWIKPNNIKQDINAICKEYGIEGYTINKDGSIDVDRKVNLCNKGLIKLPLKFRKVTGNFDCSFNELTSLEGSPSKARYFNCGHNKLTSLEHSPKNVEYFSCDNNQLTSLEGAPKSMDSFDCSRNNLKSLHGCPKKVSSFKCSYNKLTSFEFGPEFVWDSYQCDNNEITNFKGFPENFDGYLSFRDNPIAKLLSNIPEEMCNKFIYWCIEYDAISDDGELIPMRIEEVYHKLGLDYEDDEEYIY